MRGERDTMYWPLVNISMTSVKGKVNPFMPNGPFYPDYGTYLRRPAKAQASLCIRAVSPEPSLFAHMKYGSRQRITQKSDIKPHWMAAHAHLKNEFMEDKKYHNLMTWLICCLGLSGL